LSSLSDCILKVFFLGAKSAVGIDASKGKSTVAITRPFGETVKPPFEVSHTRGGLEELIEVLKALDGEVRVVTENTGSCLLTVH
jgi:hypothetical protein